MKRAAACLFQHGNGDTVPFHVYLSELCRDLQSALVPEGLEQTIDCRCEDAEIPAQLAFPLGLIVTELVTNAIKHAFPDQRPGRIDVVFQRRTEKGWRLVVADNGVGLRGPTSSSTGTVGTQIIRALIDRIHGRLASETDGGARFTVDVEAGQGPSS